MKRTELKQMIREELDTIIKEGLYTRADAAAAMQLIVNKLSQSKQLDNNLHHKFKNMIAILKSGGRDNSNFDD